MYEAGVDLVVTPYRGRPVESPWWRTAPNPTYREGESYAAVRERAGAAEGRPVPAARRGLARRERARPPHARDDLARRDAALAAAPRAARRAGAPRRRRLLHRADGALPRHPDGAARALRDPRRLLRRRRADEPARVRRHGHRLQLLPRCRPVGVRPRALELGGRAAAAARARRPPRRGRLLGRRPGVLRTAAGREGDGRLLLRLRRQVPAGVDGGDGRRAEPGGARDRLRPRRPRLPRRHGQREGDRRRAVQRLRPRDLVGADQPQRHAPLARDRAALVHVPAVRARLGRRRDRLESARGDRAVVRAGQRDRRRRGRSPGARRLPRAARPIPPRPRRWARARASGCSTSTPTPTGRAACSTSSASRARCRRERRPDRRDRPRVQRGGRDRRRRRRDPRRRRDRSTSSSSTTAPATTRRRSRARTAPRS